MEIQTYQGGIRVILSESQQKMADQQTVSSSGTSTKSITTKRGVEPSFPIKLHNLLESQTFEIIISWQPNGKSFSVHKPKEFVEFVLPKYFNQTKLKSFQRQLSFYNFKRISSGPYAGGYKHPFFIQGKAEQCMNILRSKNKNHAARTAVTSPASTPRASVDLKNTIPSMDSLIKPDVTKQLPISEPQYSCLNTPQTSDILNNSKIPVLEKIEYLIHETVEKFNMAIHQTIVNFQDSLKTIAEIEHSSKSCLDGSSRTGALSDISDSGGISSSISARYQEQRIVILLHPDSALKTNVLLNIMSVRIG